MRKKASNVKTKSALPRATSPSGLGGDDLLPFNTEEPASNENCLPQSRTSELLFWHFITKQAAVKGGIWALMFVK